MATPAKKQKGEQKKFKVLEKWFEEEKYLASISKTHPQNTFHFLFFLICEKSIPIEHQRNVWFRQMLYLTETFRTFK